MATDAETAQEAIVRFLASCRQPALLEPGEPQFLLGSDNFEYELLNGRLNLRVWDQQRTLFRKVSRVLREKTGQLELEIERFGKRIGSLQLLDLARPQSQTATRKGNRQEYRERFRRALSRQYPGWEVAEVSTEPDLEHSLSPSYPRAFLKKGTSGWAAIGAPPEALDIDGVLSFGLIWLDYLRKRERRLMVEGLIVFVPEGRERTTALRLLHLNPVRAAYHLISYTPENYENRVDLRDFGNLETGLQPRRSDPGAIHTETEGWIQSLLQIPGVEAIETGDGGASIRVRGLEFARRTEAGLSFGLETKRPVKASTVKEMESLAGELSQRRHPGAVDRQSSLYQRNPECWLESQVRQSIQQIDAGLHPAPVYGQVPAFSGRDRGVIDLLAADWSGRLAVLELKASQDIHLPLQALDYWMRVNWHVQQGTFARGTYFPGVALSKESPRMYLVAPSLEFHPSIGAILQFFSPAIEVEQIGLSMEWRRKIEVMFRMKGHESRA